MSSFVGHALAPLIVHAATEPGDAPRRAGWLLVLAALGVAPDVDYVLRALILPGPPPVRVTHSIVGALVLPTIVVLAMAIGGVRGRMLRVRGVQAAGAGLSHVALDLLVGVTPAALLWPLSMRTFRLGAGILPSAGAVSPGNPYFWRNLLLEMGVLLPLLAIVLLLRSDRPRRLQMIALASLSICCMLVSASLAR